MGTILHGGDWGAAATNIVLVGVLTGKYPGTRAKSGADWDRRRYSSRRRIPRSTWNIADGGRRRRSMRRGKHGLLRTHLSRDPDNVAVTTLPRQEVLGARQRLPKLSVGRHTGRQRSGTPLHRTYSFLRAGRRPADWRGCPIIECTAAPGTSLAELIQIRGLPTTDSLASSFLCVDGVAAHGR